jgi:hypothetical protein
MQENERARVCAREGGRDEGTPGAEASERARVRDAREKECLRPSDERGDGHSQRGKQKGDSLLQAKHDDRSEAHVRHRHQHS